MLPKVVLLCALPVVFASMALAQRLPGLAFTNSHDGEGEDADTYVWSGGKIRYHLNGPYQVAQWLPKPHAFLLTSWSDVYTWRPGSSPVLLIELSKYIKYRLFWPTVSLSPDGRTLAVYDNLDIPEEDLGTWLVDLPNRKVRQVVDDKALVKAGVVDTEGIQSFTGVAWSPDGSKIAFGCHGPMWPEGTDGEGPTQCMVWSKSGKCRSVGIGTPIAWLDNETLLCGGQIFMGDMYVAPEIFRLGSSRMRIKNIKGEYLAYADGKVFLAKENRSILVLDSRLKIIGHLRIPQYGKDQSLSNIPERRLIAIP